jgi:hypothetical protein
MLLSPRILFGSRHRLFNLPSRSIRRDAGGALGRRLSVKQEKENTLYYRRQRDSRDSSVVIEVRLWDGDLGFDSRQEQELFFRNVQIGARVHQGSYGVGQLFAFTINDWEFQRSPGERHDVLQFFPH